MRWRALPGILPHERGDAGDLQQTTCVRCGRMHVLQLCDSVAAWVWSDGPCAAANLPHAPALQSTSSVLFVPEGQPAGMYPLLLHTSTYKMIYGGSSAPSMSPQRARGHPGPPLAQLRAGSSAQSLREDVKSLDSLVGCNANDVGGSVLKEYRSTLRSGSLRASPAVIQACNPLCLQQRGKPSLNREHQSTCLRGESPAERSFSWDMIL